MERMNTPIPGCYLFDLSPFHDHRGSFLKIFQQTRFENEKNSFRPTESFYSISKKGVIRGLHFQIPPRDHDKIVICLAGKAHDAVVDLRQGSERFGKVATFALDAQAPKGVFIPRGCAHGFQALEDHTALIYLTNEEYDRNSDRGIRWDSIEGLKWPLANPVVSDRDQSFPAWQNYESPF